MPACEMCGRETPAPRRATIEGTVMNVCGNCVKFGVEIAGPKTEVTGRSAVTQSLERRAARGRQRDIYDDMQEELVENYGEVIRSARVRKGFATTEELGKKIFEKKTVLDKVEAGLLHPPEELVKKLQRELGVKLMEKPETPVGTGGAKPAGGPVTLGDLIRDAQKSKKG